MVLCVLRIYFLCDRSLKMIGLILARFWRTIGLGKPFFFSPPFPSLCLFLIKHHHHNNRDLPDRMKKQHAAIR